LEARRQDREMKRKEERKAEKGIGDKGVLKIIINNTIDLFFKLQSAFW